MPKERKKRPTQHSRSEKRERRDLEAKLLVAENEEKADEILRLQDLSKVNSENTLKTAKSIAFIHISFEIKPKVKYCLKVEENLEFEMWHNEKLIWKERVSAEFIRKSPRVIKSKKVVIHILEYLHKLISNEIPSKVKVGNVI